MKVNLAQSYRLSLLQTPVDLPVLITLEKPTEAALAIRVSDLFSLRRQGLPIITRPIGYHGKEGVWVGAIAFRVVRTSIAPFEGVAYLNPRQEEDLQLLERLAKQERLPFIFFSPHLKIAVRQDAVWSVHHRQEVRLLLAQIGHSPTHKRGANSEDPDFARVRQEFQSLYSVKTLITTRRQGEGRVSSLFRGVVLD